MHWDALKGKKLVVVDASVILKWVLPEEQEENVLESLSLRDAIVAETVSGLVPALWYFEVGNIVSRVFSAGDADDTLNDLRALGLVEVPIGRSMQNQALLEVNQCKVTFYDAIYRAIYTVAVTTLQSECALITADEQYRRKIAAIFGNDTGTIHIQDWPALAAKWNVETS